MQGSGFICWGKNGYFPLCVASVSHWECAALISFLSRRWDFRGRWGYVPGAMMCEDWGLVWASEFMLQVRGWVTEEFPVNQAPLRVCVYHICVTTGRSPTLPRNATGVGWTTVELLGVQGRNNRPLFLPHMDLPTSIAPQLYEQWKGYSLCLEA